MQSRGVLYNTPRFFPRRLPEPRGLPAAYGLLWWSRRVPRLQEPGVRDGQPEVAPKVVLMGLY